MLCFDICWHFFEILGKQAERMLVVSMFYSETKIHRVYDEDGTVHNYHCLKVHGDSCPLCDTYYGLWKTGSKDDETTARQIKPRARYYMNVVDRESGDVKILSVGIILFKKMIAAMLDEDFGDITDLQEGLDFKIIKQMEGQWPRYDQSAPRPKSSPTGSNSEVAAYMESLHDIFSLNQIVFKDHRFYLIFMILWCFL